MTKIYNLAKGWILSSMAVSWFREFDILPVMRIKPFIAVAQLARTNSITGGWWFYHINFCTRKGTH